MNKKDEKFVDPRNQRKERIKENLSRIKHKILVMSGKGGVGKTTVAVNLAVAFADMGKQVGLLDIDLHGPNAALMAGAADGSMAVVDEKIRPAPASGIQVVSLAGLLPREDSAVIWRGPIKNTVIEQFLGDSEFGDLDVLVVDLPPGTGDEPLSLVQLIPDADGTVVVTGPQAVALMDGKRSITFARQVNLSILGVVENFSGLTCPHCGKEILLFGPGGSEAMAKEMDVPFLGKIPISMNGAAAGDQGRPLVRSHPDDPAASALKELAITVGKKINLGLETSGTSAKDSSRHEDKEGTMETQNSDKAKEKEKINMKVAIACADSRGLDAEVSAHFGRCPYYTVASVENGEVVGHEVAENPYYNGHEPGVVPEFIKNLGVDAILAGGMGPRAIQLFESFGIDAATGAAGIAGKVLEAYLSGELTGVVPCDHDHEHGHGGHELH
ncbi:MAG: P-loop NTPase [Deltaproteobacteria bacterium]|nr:P-loop NTPase [Deltaproteobacteria bacterium]